MTDTNKNPDPKRKPAADETNPPPKTKFLSRRDRTNRLVPAIFSLTPYGKLGMTEKTLGWFQALRPNGMATAVNFLRTDTHTLAVPAQVGDDNAMPLNYSKTGRTAWCWAHLGFYPEDIPLLAEGTVYFDAEQLQTPDGTPCLGVNYATAELAKVAKAAKAARTPAKRRRKSGNKHGTPGTTIHQAHIATAAAQAEAMKLLAQAKALSEAAAASQAAAIQAAALQAAAIQAAAIQAAVEANSGQAATSEGVTATPPDAEKPDTQA